MPYKAWGEPYKPGFEESRAGNGSCPDPSCWEQYDTWYDSPLDYWQHVVGFSPEQPITSARKDVCIGILIVECPGCYKKYWFHAVERDREIGMQLGKWPKD